MSSNAQPSFLRAMFSEEPKQTSFLEKLITGQAKPPYPHPMPMKPSKPSKGGGKKK